MKYFIEESLNIPLGESKKVKGVARLSTEQKNRIEKELSQEFYQSSRKS